MEKRLFLAILLSIFVLIVYSSIMSQFAPKQTYSPLSLEDKPAQKSLTAQEDNYPQTTVNKEVMENIETEPFDLEQNLSPIALQNNKLQLLINVDGTGVKEAIDKTYDIPLPQINIGGLRSRQGQHSMVKEFSNGLEITFKDNQKNLIITQTYRLIADSNLVELNIDIVNNSKQMSYIDYSLNIASIKEDVIKKNPMDSRYYEFSISLPDKVLRKQFTGFKPPAYEAPIEWIGVRDRYFCSIVKPLQATGRLEKVKKDGVISYLLHSKSIPLSPFTSTSQNFEIYIGPQIPDTISEWDPECAAIVNYGFLDTVSQMLLGVLRFLNNLCKNWGLTIIVFSFLVFVALSPLSIKSFSSMKRMQELQPAMEALKQKYKDSPQKLNKELMELYREKKINPLGGCLPMLLQMPIFISLFKLLMRLVDLKGESFLWINDLSMPDRLIMLPRSFPIIGNEINLLPLLMIGTMLLQQRLTSAQHGKGESAANQQKMMSLFMSVFFGIIFYHMPSCLVLYWSVNSFLMLLFQMRIFAKPKGV